MTSNRRSAAELFDAIAVEAAGRVQRGQFTQQNIGNIAWAFAKADHPNAAL
eukprot:gene11859-biopygen6938